MTKSEAIKELRNIRPKGGIIPQKRAEAIDIAIEVLEKEVSREQYHCEDCEAQSALNLLCRKLDIKPMHLNKIGGGTGEMIGESRK